MNQEQIERLKAVLEEIKDPDTILETCYYVGVIGTREEGCYCAVGFLIKDDPAPLWELRRRNGSSISSWHLANVRVEIFRKYGLTEEQLVELQRINDGIGYFDRLAFKPGVIAYLEDILSNAQKQLKFESEDQSLTDRSENAAEVKSERLESAGEEQTND